MTPTQFIHQQAGYPAGKHDTEAGSGPCMICGAGTDGAQAVPAKRIIKSTTVGDSQLFRFRQAYYFCEACAWLMEIGKGQPGNFIATGGEFERAVISLESVVENKRPWLDIIHDITILDIYHRMGPNARNGIIGRSGETHGRIDYLREHYPDAWRLAKKNGWL